MGRPTMDDVAAAAGVSRALVSLVVRESPRVSDHSRAKVLAAASELGYRPNALARNLASGETQTIGVMLNDFHNPYFTEMAEGAAHTADDNGLQLLINSGWQRDAGEERAIEALLNLRMDGLVLVAPRLPLEVLREIAAQAPLVCVAAFVETDAFDTINNDEDHGAAAIFDHLVELGHSRIAYLDAHNLAGGRQRSAAYGEAMVARGLSPTSVRGDFNEKAGYEAAEQLMSLRQPPTAIVAGNDLAAVGVMTRLQELGLSVPGDVSVMGYDDTLLAGIGPVSLTTMHQPRARFGQVAVELLVERIAGRAEARHELIQARLVTRASTATLRH